MRNSSPEALSITISDGKTGSFRTETLMASTTKRIIVKRPVPKLATQKRLVKAKMSAQSAKIIKAFSQIIIGRANKAYLKAL